jgi:hypothetical protein
LVGRNLHHFGYCSSNRVALALVQAFADWDRKLVTRRNSSPGLVRLMYLARSLLHKSIHCRADMEADHGSSIGQAFCLPASLRLSSVEPIARRLDEGDLARRLLHYPGADCLLLWR